MIRRLVLLGATGDLASRKIAPALAALAAADDLPQDFSVLGIARHDWDTERFRRHFGAHVADLGALGTRLGYRAADVTAPAALARALGAPEEPVVLYLALPPGVAAKVVDGLSNIRLPHGSRIVCEKPFGTGLAAARELNRRLRTTFPENAIFRVDHFLMKQTIQNVLGLRFGNRLIESAWNRDHIARVEIVYDERLALEDRAGYYDRSGALRDMIQSHLLQLVSLVGMEAPLTLGERDLRDRKVDVLRAVRSLSPEEVERFTVRARYSAGRTGDRDVPAYADECGVEPDRGTETYAETTLWIDNWRWSGVPFVLRTGKALGHDRRAIAVRFREVPHLAFEAGEPCENILTMALDPDRLSLALNVNAIGEPFRLACIALQAELAGQPLPAYARLLADVLEGDATLSIRGDEAEESWRIVAPILEAWAQGRSPLREYPAGSDGPPGGG